MNRILNVMPVGKDNAIHQCELAKRLCVSTSAAKTMVRKARQNGVPILSDLCGYWLADDQEDIKQFVSMMNRQAYSRLKCARAITKAGSYPDQDKRKDGLGSSGE